MRIKLAPIGLAVLFVALVASPFAAANPGYGPKCFQCHTSPEGGSSDLNGVGAKFARDGHKFPKEEEKKEEKKEGEEGSAEGSGETTGEAGSEGGSGATSGTASSSEGSSDGGGGSGDSSSGPSPDGSSSSTGGDSGSYSSPAPVDDSPAVEGAASIVTGPTPPVTTAQAPSDPAGASAQSGGPGSDSGPSGDPSKELARYGASGKKVFSLVSPKLSSIGKSCATCHADGALAGKWGDYPKFRPELGKVVTFEQAVQWCLENNMKGRVLPLDDKYMVALSVYLKGLSK
ncbi:MAG: hypothetical protein HYY25_02585 [Candidatus Wallbacteria bacterium]|nr:hypothetical protein [Candidatus Wallbacteria bacterium]